jgi:hypothetical protein
MPNFEKVIAALSLICLASCSFFTGISEKPEKPEKPTGPIATLTGEVIRTENGYRFKPLKETEALHLTKATARKEAAAEEINLRKYFGKTLVIRGQRQDDWIFRAEVMGQWLRPGEKRGSTLLGPEPKPQ